MKKSLTNKNKSQREKNDVVEEAERVLRDIFDSYEEN